MNLKRLWVIFKARNYEFFRDRAAFGWNFLFPFLLIAGFALIFGGQDRPEYKIGVFPMAVGKPVVEELQIPAELKKNPQVEFIGLPSMDLGLEKLRHHKIDLLLETGESTFRYWVSDSSPKGYTSEQMLMASLIPPSASELITKSEIHGREIRYIEWLFPGILGMNMMFSALYGVGYTVVRYRKLGVLKRLKATPLTAFEYLSAQVLSRIFLLMFTFLIVWFGCHLIFSFNLEGSLMDLFIVYSLGGACLSSIGLVVAARGISEEFANGVLNFISWPMMFLSEVWFSIEGAPEWLKGAATLFPLTHILTGARKIMNDGVGLADVGVELMVLSAMTMAFLLIGAALFSWNK
ncbi:MAG: ABC transporter permease [Desulfobacteraceae bacterium]|nr:ABC transporter permease [Desulfobacteraceae bacterium]